MKYLKTFEKVVRTFNIGDNVVWSHKDRATNFKRPGFAPLTNDVEYGDVCKVTDVKGMKGELYVRLENLKNNRHINTFLNSEYRIKTRNEDGDWFEAKYNIRKIEDFSWDIFSSIQFNRIDIIKDLIENSNGLNIKNGEDRTPIIFSAYVGNIEIVKLLINYGSNYNSKDKYDNYFIDYLDDYGKKIIEEEYPKIYNDYITIKETERFNL